MMTFRLHLLCALMLAALASVSMAANTVADETRIRCEALKEQSTNGTVIVSAELIAEGATVPGARLPGADGAPGGGTEIRGLPAFCRVLGSLRPEPGSDIGFEVWMPVENWDGRLHGIGIGGFAGSIDYMTLSGAIRSGQAAAATDTGHKGGANESDWAKGNPQKIRDHGWRGVHLTTVTAKQMIWGFYGRGPDRSYFVGCSGGGRQGLIEASRFPDDYDGIIAGAPAAVWTDLALSFINAIQAQNKPGAKIRPEQAELLETEVLNQCDALDGQRDGLVSDPRRCDFDASRLSCNASDSAQCFTQPQLDALRQIMAGPHDSSGVQLANGYIPVGSEAGMPLPTLGWETYLLGDAPAAQLLAGGLLKNFFDPPFATPETFDFDTHTARIKAEVGTDLDVTPDLQAFFDRGGKLILWHGWADAAIPPPATLDLYQQILRDSGPTAEASSQLFMVPGVQHCFGGKGPGSFGQLGAPAVGETPQTNLVSALQAWVEEGREPQQLSARFGFSGFMGAPRRPGEPERLICAEPSVAVLTPGEAPDRAASYTCKARVN